MLFEKFNHDWKFWKEKDAFALVWDIPEIAQELILPHDAMIHEAAYAGSPNGGRTGYHDGAVYVYVKNFIPPTEYRDKTVILKFEGVYMNAFVYVNGQLAGKRPYGYSQFYVPLNDYLNYGQENEIRVLVRNGAMTNSRWYSGGGIYRDVYLGVAGLSYVVPDGVFVVTQEADEELAVLRITTELKNRSHRKENLVLETAIYDNADREVAKDAIPVILFEREKRVMHQLVEVNTPKLWDEYHPNLYHCVTRLYCEGEMLEETASTFGIRTLCVDAKRGLRVNGKTVKLRGTCVHHDSGLLGAATYDDAQFRQVKLLKEAGFNAIRMAHHPMAPNMLRACDVLGMYVMDESFDMWSRCKSDYDYGMNFDEWWERDVEEMVRKDRNHPSVIMYSTGNEIPEIGSDYGAKIGYQQAEKIRQLDPTRYTTAGINGPYASSDMLRQIMDEVANQMKTPADVLKGNVNDFLGLLSGDFMKLVANHPILSERVNKACASLDIAGYNYLAERYESDRINHPHRVIVGSETFPPHIGWEWDLIMNCSHVIGDFTWTGWDYIGEVGVGVVSYPSDQEEQLPLIQLAYCGDIDLTGYRRPASYYREIVFGLRKSPYISVQNPKHYGESVKKSIWAFTDSVHCWNYPGMEGKTAVIEVYSAGDEVELFLNQKSLGRKPAGKDTLYRVFFETPYQPGILTAVTYENGIEIGRSELKSAKDDRRLAVSADTLGTELIYLAIEILDQDGILAADAKDKLTIEVKGAAEAAGFGSGNPRPKYEYTGANAELFHGRALAILRRKNTPGDIHVTITSEQYDTTTICLPV